MVSKSDITTNKPTTSDLIQVSSGEKVLAEVENANNLLNLNALILAYNWIIDSGVELSAANTFTADQTFDTIKTAYLESLTGSSDVVLQNGTFKYGGTATNLELATQLYVANQIAAAGTFSLDLEWAGIQTTSFTSVKGKVYGINTTSGAITATLDASPADKDVVAFTDTHGKFSDNTFTVGRAGKKIQGLSEDMDFELDYVNPAFAFDSATDGWWLIGR